MITFKAYGDLCFVEVVMVDLKIKNDHICFKSNHIGLSYK